MPLKIPTLEVDSEIGDSPAQFGVFPIAKIDAANIVDVGMIRGKKLDLRGSIFLATENRQNHDP